MHTQSYTYSHTLTYSFTHILTLSFIHTHTLSSHNLASKVLNGTALKPSCVGRGYLRQLAAKWTSWDREGVLAFNLLK